MVLWGCGVGGERRGERREGIGEGGRTGKREGECAGMGSATWAMRNGSEGEFEIKPREEECEEGRGEMCEEKEGGKPRQRFQSPTYHSDGPKWFTPLQKFVACSLAFFGFRCNCMFLVMRDQFMCG